MKQTTKTQNLKNPVTLKKSCPELVSGLFQDLAHDKISWKITKDKLFLRPWQSFASGQMLNQVQHDIPPHVIALHEKEIMSSRKPRRGTSEARDEQQSTEMLNFRCCCERCRLMRGADGSVRSSNDMKVRKCAFTLAETLIALAVIGIVAALTIPGIVKNHNEHAWSTGKDVFTKRLDVALKEMNTEGSLTGYKTTAAFIDELKKNIKITQICTDDVTKCFAKNVQARQYNGEVTLNNDNAIECETNAGQDWAENVGIRFANGVNAIISYNKNCTSDPYNNQFSPSPACIGIIYDVSGNKKPNASGKDIGTNANVAKVGGKSLCAFEFKYKDNDPVCFTKIVPPGSYEPLSKSECEKQKTALGLDGCVYDDDYFAGVAAVCGGKTEMAKSEQLTLLAKYLYETDDINEIYDTSISSSAFNSNVLNSPFGAYYNSNSWFAVWVGAEYSSYIADYRYFNSYCTTYYNHARHDTGVFAVCSDDQSFYNIVASAPEES